MSYTLVTATVLPLWVGSAWTEKDISEEIFSDVFQNYKQVYLTLTNPGITGDVYVDINDLRPEAYSSALTVTDYITSLGDATLTVVSSLPTTEVVYAKFVDARQGGYQIQKTLIGADDLSTLTSDQITDLVLTRDSYSTDMTQIHTSCLVTVNGYLHQTAVPTTTTEVAIYDGAKVLINSQDNAVGIISFVEVGTLTKYPFLNSIEILPQVDGDPLNGYITWASPETLDGKCVMLSLGGYLVLPEDDVFWISGTDILTLNFSRIPFLQRLYESSRYLDLSGLALTELYEGSESYNVDDLYSDDVIQAYFNMSQSFMIVLDAEDLVWTKKTMKSYNVPNTFTSYFEPTQPLIGGYGRLIEYWKSLEYTFWEIKTHDGFRRKYIFDTTYQNLLGQISPAVIPAQKASLNKGVLLEIGTYAT